LNRILAVFPFVVTIVLLGLLLACSPKVEAPREGDSPKPASEVSVSGKGGWEKEWEETLAAARKEGRVVVYMTGGSVIRDALVKSFKDAYGIPVETLVGTGNQVAEKLIREYKSGLYLADVYNGGVTTPVNILKPAGVLDPLDRMLLMPDLTVPAEIEKAWWNGKLPWVDSEHKVMAFMAYPQAWAFINTDFIKPEEMQSFKDLLNPRWKGKIVMFDPTMTGAGGKLLSVTATQILNMDFWREFAKQDPVFYRDHRVMVEGVARGKNYIGVAAKPDEVALFMDTGAPLMHRTPVEGIGLTTGSGGLALPARAPHPNAAKIFINWLLSKQGSRVFSEAFDAQSARMDVATDFLSADKIRQPSVKYFYAEVEEFLKLEPDLASEARQIFGIK